MLDHSGRVDPSISEKPMPPPTALVMVMSAANEMPRVLLFPAPGAFLASIETLVQDYDLTEIGLHPDGTLRLANGLRLAMWEAAVLEEPISLAVIIAVDGVLASVHLVRNLASAATVIGAARGQGLGAVAVTIEAMPFPGPLNRRPSWRVLDGGSAPVAVRTDPAAVLAVCSVDQRLTEIGELMARVATRHVPPSALSPVICSLCLDHQLHVDPTLDGFDNSGQRVCSACVRLALIRREFQTS